MKKFIYSIMSLVAVAGMVTSCDNVDDYNSNIHDPQIPNMIEEVDLGLEDGTVWASANLGANSVYDLGTYYEYADVQAAIENKLGSDWTLPTPEQIQNLINGCTWTKSAYNGMGILIGTAKPKPASDSKAAGEEMIPAPVKKIYIPLSGRINEGGTTIVNRSSHAYLWTNVSAEETATCADIAQGKSSTTITISDVAKAVKNTVRCVKKEKVVNE